MVTREERREIAERIRSCDKTQPFALLSCIFPGGPYTGEMMMRTFDKLADLIEPEPERTCKIVSEHYYDDYDQYETELSCGHIIDTHDKLELCVSFCPRCGAKVMWDE